MVKEGARHVVAGAAVIGMFLMHHKIVSGVAIAFVLAAVVASSTFTVLGRGSGQTFDGTSAPGSHQFYSLGDAEGDFCIACHSAIGEELAASMGIHKDNYL